MQLNSFQKWWVNSWPHRMRVRAHVPYFLKSSPEPVRGEVLEVGAGRGYTSQAILRTFPQVELTATDIDTEATAMFSDLQEMYGRRLHIKEANMVALPFDRASFDFAIAVNVFWSLPNETIPLALREIIRVLRPGGLIGISEYIALGTSLSSSRDAVEGVLKDEECDIIFTKGNKRYDLWARKPYPIKGGV